MILKKNEIVEELKNVKYNDIEDMVYRMQLTNDEIIDILDLKYIPSKRSGHQLNPSVYEVINLNKTLRSLLPDTVEVNITIDVIRIKSDLNINQTLRITKKNFPS